MPSRILKAEIDSLTEHLQRNPTYEKREGEALTSPGNPLANLTTVKLSRIRSPETSSRRCVESKLCKVYPELYIPPLTQPSRNAPNLYHFMRLGVLCWLEAESRMVFWCGSLIWWADLLGCWLVWPGRWVWRSALVGCCSCLVWRLDLDGWSVLMVWTGVDFLSDVLNGLTEEQYPNFLKAESWKR